MSKGEACSCSQPCVARMCRLASRSPARKVRQSCLFGGMGLAAVLDQYRPRDYTVSGESFHLDGEAAGGRPVVLGGRRRRTTAARLASLRLRRRSRQRRGYRPVTSRRRSPSCRLVTGRPGLRRRNRAIVWASRPCGAKLTDCLMRRRQHHHVAVGFELPRWRRRAGRWSCRTRPAPPAPAPTGQSHRASGPRRPGRAPTARGSPAIAAAIAAGSIASPGVSASPWRSARSRSSTVRSSTVDHWGGRRRSRSGARRTTSSEARKRSDTAMISSVLSRPAGDRGDAFDDVGFAEAGLARAQARRRVDQRGEQLGITRHNLRVELAADDQVVDLRTGLESDHRGFVVPSGRGAAPGSASRPCADGSRAMPGRRRASGPVSTRTPTRRRLRGGSRSPRCASRTPAAARG